MAGLSVYVAMGAGLTAALWLCILLGSRRFGDAGRLVGAGALSAVLAAPWLLSVVDRVSDKKATIDFNIRNSELLAFSTGSASLDVPLALFQMVVIYAINFGVFFLGAEAYWKKAGRNGLKNDLALLLGLGTVSSFVIGSFVESTLLQNDLGWRVMLFAQLATLLWTASALRTGALLWRSPVVFLMLAAGYASVAYGALQFRLFSWRRWPSEIQRVAVIDEKHAWQWINANLPADAVAQARPTNMIGRAYGYGLYAQRRAALADSHVSVLFGASSKAVAARAAELLPIFDDTSLSSAEVDVLAARHHINAVVVTDADRCSTPPAPGLNHIPQRSRGRMRACI